MNTKQLIEYIKKSTQHNFLYHFTDTSNFSSINTHGLLSKNQMKTKDIIPDAPGGNEWSRRLDAAKGIDRYVSLCMTRNHPMKFLAEQDGRLPNAYYLGINPEVLEIEGTMIALGIANAINTELLLVRDAIPELDTEVIYSRTDWSDSKIQARLKAANKYEVLVPNMVPRKMIMGVF